MRKIIYILIVALLSMNAMAIEPTITAPKINADDWSGSIGRDRAWRWAIAMENAVEAGDSLGTGTAFYVDSGVSNAGDGSSWLNAVATLDEAINLCTANRGDIIYVAQGHAETWTAADSADVDLVGISIFGMGVGTDRPTFTYTANGELVIGAANTLVSNLIFAPGAANVTHAIEIEADADFSIIQFCEFQSGSTDAFEFVDAIQLATAADDITIRYNDVIETTAGANTWVDLTTGIVNNVQIVGNRIGGDYAEAPIESDKACTDMLIAGNVITNLNAGEHAIELSGNATGVIAKNLCIVDDPAIVIDAGYCECIGNDFGDYDANIDSDFGPRWMTTAVSDTATVFDMTPEIADNSILANIMTSDGDTSGYNETTDSLEAIADTIAALTGVGFRETCEVNAGGAGFFTAVGLAGFGNDFFNTGWYVVVTYDAGAAGAAPEGEVRDIVDYVSATGVFTIGPVTSAAITTGDKVKIVRVEEMNFDATATLGGSGRIMYVDSGVAGTADVGDLGDTWDLAYPTIATALAGGTLSNGDVIYLAAGHTETIADAQLAWNIAGVDIIGIGVGDQQPTIVFNHANASIDVTAANIYVENVKFETSVDNCLIAIDVAATGDGLHLKDCVFSAVAVTDEWLEIIQLATGADDVIIETCQFLNVGASCTEAIIAEAGVVDNLQIIGNWFMGDFAVSAIWSDQINTNCLIRDNVIHNVTTGQHCIELTGASTGDIVNNALYGDTEGAILDSGSMIPFGNNIGVILDVEALPGWVIDQDLNHLMETAVADVVTPFDMTPEVPDNTVLANLMTNDGNTSDYDETTDSLEALADMLYWQEKSVKKTATAADDDLFDVDGGTILITSLTGKVSTEIGAGANTLQIIFDADGVPDIDSNFTTAVDIDGDVVGTRYTFTAAAQSVLVPVSDTTGNSNLMSPWFCGAGVIEQNSQGAPAGAIIWYMTYRPLETGVTVTAN